MQRSTAEAFSNGWLHSFRAASFFLIFFSPRSRFFISRARVPSSLRWATGCIQPSSNTLKQTIPHDVVWTPRVSELNQVDVHRARTKITMCCLPVAFVNLPTFTNRNRQATHRVLAGPLGCGRPQVSLTRRHCSHGRFGRPCHLLHSQRCTATKLWRCNEYCKAHPYEHSFFASIVHCKAPIWRNSVPL